VPLAELLLRPEVAQEFDARGGLPIAFGRRQDDAHDVVAAGRAREPQQPPVGARGPRDLALLAQVDVGLGRGEPFGGARLDLDEAERRPVVGDEVQVDVRGRPLRCRVVKPPFVPARTA